MKKFIIAAAISLISFSPFTLTANTSKQNIVRCEYKLRKCFEAIMQIPEAKTLIDGIRKEGSFDITMEHSTVSNRFGAYWDPDLRVICVDPYSDEADIIASLLFELHNASVNAKINRLNELATQRLINKDDYIESMEYLEYINSKNAAKIADKGIRMGLLPCGAQLPTYSSFKEHFMAQKMSGHSDTFARNYELCLLMN